MSNLNWYWVYVPYLDAPNRQQDSAIRAGYNKVVFKSEADKVIDELKQKINEAQTELELWRDGSIISEQHQKELDEKRHSDYKRCLAMASWCCDACDKWMMRKAKAIGLGEEGVKEYHRARSKLSLYMRWQMRWLKIAEQFKEGI